MKRKNWLNLSVSLKILALVLWFYIPVFIVTATSLVFPQNQFLRSFTPEVRGEYQWDFELMFVSIFLVWGIFLWRAAQEPQKHSLFIDFSIWANIAHGISMIVIGMLREGEFHHLLQDGVVLILPALFVWYCKKSEM